jgi:hypothetical protein
MSTGMRAFYLGNTSTVRTDNGQRVMRASIVAPDVSWRISDKRRQELLRLALSWRWRSVVVSGTRLQFLFLI